MSVEVVVEAVQVVSVVEEAVPVALLDSIVSRSGTGGSRDSTCELVGQ